MNHKKLKHTPLLVIGLTALLAACTPSGNGSGTSVPASSEEPLLVGVPEDFKTGSLTLRIESNVIAEGNTFFDGCTPSVTYGSTDRSDRVTYKVSDLKGNEYAADAPLRSGTYRIRANYSTYYTTGQFEVQTVNLKDEDRDAGYSVIREEETLATRVENWDYVGALGNGKTQSIGTPKLLVIPVTFQDTSFSTSELENLKKAYFGDASETGWESLTSYYEKSSYGKLKIEGDLTDVYKYPQSSLDFENDVNAGSKSTDTIAEAAVAWAKSNGVNLKDYDNNGDGFLDGVELIYKSSRTNRNNQKLWWCFTTSVQAKKPAEGNDPVLNRYFWSLSSQQQTGYYSPNIDAHTLIHETGHMLGLNDYYDYGGTTNPAGFSDMMDHNVGDHGAYSKYMLGWVTPKYVDGSKDNFTITLDDFTNTGDCLIVRNTTTDPWNKTPYDEYLMLEYYTPTGVNEKDANGYREWMLGSYTKGTGGTYAKAGLKVSHIDNRLVSYVGDTLDLENNSMSNTHASYTDTLSNELEIGADGTATKTPSFQVSSNTESYSGEVSGSSTLYGAKVRENTLIAPNGDPSVLKGNAAVSYMGYQNFLYGTEKYSCGGAFYSSYTVKDFFPNGTTWNDGSRLNYSFRVESQTDTSITLRFFKNF